MKRVQQVDIFKCSRREKASKEEHLVLCTLLLLQFFSVLADTSTCKLDGITFHYIDPIKLAKVGPANNAVYHLTLVNPRTALLQRGLGRA